MTRERGFLKTEKRLQDGRRFQGLTPREAFSVIFAGSANGRQEGPVQRESDVHCCFPLYLLSLQSAAALWYSLCHWIGSFLLDASHSGIQSRHSHGAWNHSHRYIRACHAATCWFQAHRGGQQCQGGPCPFVRICFIPNCGFLKYSSLLEDSCTAAIFCCKHK